jgi:hypothetical protein
MAASLAKHIYAVRSMRLGLCSDVTFRQLTQKLHLRSALLHTTTSHRMTLAPEFKQSSSVDFPEAGLQRIIAYPFPTEHRYWAIDRSFDTYPSGIQLTVAERQMLGFLGSITDKRDWQRKLRDPEIRTRWRKELEDQPHTAHSRDTTFVFPPEAFDYVSCLGSYTKPHCVDSDSV